LIGWDAADWKVIHPLMDAGKMPNVQRLIENGAMAQIATLHPPLSPMLWTSIATGKRPFKHGIHGFSEPTADGGGVQPVTNLSRKCKAVWNILNQNDLKSIVIGWWPSHPAEPINGVMVSDHFHRAYGPLEKGWPLPPGTVHPPELANRLAELRLHPDELDGVMIEFFVPRAREVNQDTDHRLAAVATILCECVSMHSAATWLLENREWDFFAVYYDAIDHFCHGFMRYHPPRQERIPEADFELYKNVVSAGYQLHDQMLGTLLRKAGENVNVVLMSDHGFHPDHLRPRGIPAIPAGPTIEHRDFGILVMSGPGFKKDELFHGASVLDIAPTLLTLFGLPVGADMDGKVLAGAFEEPPKARIIPSWEDVPGQDGRHPPHTRLDPVAARESLEQLVALGYIERPDENREKAVADTVAELRYNLGEAYQDAGRHAEALEIFRELYQHDPDEQRYAVHLFVSCQALGYVAEMRRIVADLDGPRRAKFEQAQVRLKELGAVAIERLEERKARKTALEGAAPADPASESQSDPLLTGEEREEFERCQRLSRFQPPVVDYLNAQVLAAERKYFDALECLQRVQEAHLARPGLFLQTADLQRRLGRWDEAEQTYQKALSVDPDNPHAHVGMCRVALRRRDFSAAANAALAGLQRLYEHPLGHFLLGVSLTGSKDFARAADALRAALALNPNFPQAHLRLAMLLKRRLNDPEAAEEHMRLYRELRRAARGGPVPEPPREEPEPAGPVEAQPVKKPPVPDRLPPLGGEMVIVSGLPRSGTSMVMQMLAAGGLPVLADGLRQADEDNPRGYFEYEPVKRMHKGEAWAAEAEGKAVKIVAPLLAGLPHDAACRVIFIERNLDEVLASQGQMILRRGAKVVDTPARRARLKLEYGKLVWKVKSYLANRPGTHALYLNYDAVLRDPGDAARAVNAFLGGSLAVEKMATEVRPALQRQKAG
jgi:predicted AlkP superfamily phosphohydrolase/phosphomutase/tetratricopeptide (TPR) repeat protein